MILPHPCWKADWLELVRVLCREPHSCEFMGEIALLCPKTLLCRCPLHFLALVQYFQPLPPLWCFVSLVGERVL